MSSLAGALDDFRPSNSHQVVKNEHSFPGPSEDIEMQSEDSEADEEAQDAGEEMDDLFGNDNDIEESKPAPEVVSPSASAPDSERLPSPEREHRQALEYEEDDIPPEIAVEVKEAEVAFPNIPVPKGSDGTNWVIRMPNFVKVDSKPFHPDTYMGPEHDDDDAPQTESIREKSMTIKLKVENTRRQSNSRVIRWSDGTLSLRLGKELFDINQSLDNSASIPRQFIGSQSSQQPTSQSQTEAPIRSQGLTYLVAQHKRSQVLQSEAVITGYMTLRPTGMQSETHRMLVRAVGQKHNKVARLRMAPDPTMDPEREKMELMKQSMRKSKKKHDYDDLLSNGRKRKYSRKTAGRDVWSDDDDDDAAAIFAASDEDEDDARVGNLGRKAKRKGADDGKDPEDYQEDDFVVADSSDEDAGPRGSGTGKTRHTDDMEEDPLDKLDAKIREQQDAEKRRSKAAATEDGDDNANAENSKGDEMDVESEEGEDDDEEEEFKVRRAGGSGTRKRAAVFDEEEE
ncbi:Leo1-like protein-domain-containing protein [Collybia nuda]|uniref:Leo1-like protein-domain-containing protein n=1 Tax=Collybia nuda TaxID=64659 RepID=A0A9P5Y860_9AGAR|nr:Leo1-like protein-domain-containing protein [Collybia nuda]